MAEGDGSSRNFRSTYYEKLGFSGNEEKNILDLLIASCPLDLEKLSDFCDRSDLDRRCIETWKVLLGVECAKTNPFDGYANVKKIRAEHFQSLKHNLDVLLRHNVVIKDRLEKCSSCEPNQSNYHDHINHSDCNGDHSRNEHKDANIENVENDDNSSPRVTSSTGNNHEIPDSNLKYLGPSSTQTLENNPGRQITLMYLLEAGRLDSTGTSEQLNSDYCRKLSAMASFFVNVSSDRQEAFFLFRNFARKLEENETLNSVDSNKTKLNS